MFEFQPSSIWATLGLLFALGFRHGLDPDHIAAVDGLTRMRFNQHSFWSARLTGAQFASGHSLTVFLATLIFYWQGVSLPVWLDQLGLWISSLFLIWLAYSNLRYCLGRDDHTHAHSSLKALVFKSLGPLAHPMGVGFAFALSFDTLAHAGLMAHKGHEMGGFQMILCFAFCFGLGMMLADSMNGFIVHWMVKSSEALAQQTARLMSGLIASLSLLVVGIEQGREHFALLDQFWEAYGAWISGLGTLCLVLLVWRFKSKTNHATHSHVHPYSTSELKPS
jgi:high-affinity nickel-transport protein